MRPVYALGYIALSAVLLVLAAGMAVAQPETQMGRLDVRITTEGVIETPTGQLGGGLYLVTVKNETQGHRGVVLKGIDRGVSPYIRFTKVLTPGQQVSFRWYFPSDRQVTVKDLLACRHQMRTCTVARFGEMTTTLNFA
jgi:hypothetical protein